MSRPRARSTRLLLTGLVVCCLLVLCGPVWSSPAAYGRTEPQPGAHSGSDAKIRPELARQLSERATVDFWVRFTGRADLARARRVTGWAQRGASVAADLRRTARDSQTQVRALLRSSGVDYQAFWVTNALKVTAGSAELARRLASRPEVAALWPSFRVQAPRLRRATAVPTVGSVEWGVANINADDVWEQYGVRGEDIVVASIDTGVQFDHPALVDQYRGTRRDGTFDHNYNWFDAAGTCGPAPCDDNGHGTHTMGTMAGSDGAGNEIGVAPGVRWITANGCCPSDTALVASGQWMLAPTDLSGQNPDPSMRPHIVNNSWGTEDPSNEPFLDDISHAWAASGIFGVWANGNSGPGCRTSGSPGSLVHNYSVGAYDADGAVATFSSRGEGQNGEIKPNISAPGANVRSSMPGDEYDTLNGTSMAAPHVAGAIALMWSAAPAMARDLETTRSLLDSTAVDRADGQCGGTTADNNVYGEGQLDVLRLMDQAPIGPTGRVGGTVTDAATGAPVAGAHIDIEGPVDREVVTDASGSYRSGALPVGGYTVTASSYGWVTEEGFTEVGEGVTATVDLALDAADMATVTGVVRDGSGHGWPLYAKLSIAGYPGGPVFTDPATGRYAVSLAQGTAYEVTVFPQYDGYRSRNETITVGTTDLDHDIVVRVDRGTCTAPGYRWDGYGQGFDDWVAARPQDGWAIRGRGWRFDNPGQRSAPVGSGGRFAVADSARLKDKRIHATLVSPALDLRGRGRPTLTFDSAYHAGSRTQRARVAVSIDNGRTWRTAWQRTRRPAVGEVTVPLRGAAKRNVRVRFDYQGRNARWWAVDDVFVGARTCVRVRGGLVVGVTSDRDTADPVFATVSARRGEASTRSLMTPRDPSLPDGFYALFVPGSGVTALTARAPEYASGAAEVRLIPGAVVIRDWALIAEAD